MARRGFSQFAEQQNRPRAVYTSIQYLKISMRGILCDLKLVVRQLRTSPGFTATAVLMLAFGIGATTAIFSIVDGVLLRPLPFPGANLLVTLGDQVSNTDWGKQDPGPVTGPEVVIYPRDTHSFESLGGYGGTSYELSGIGEPAQINGARMTPSIFAALGVAPIMGRVFTAQEDQQKQQVAVLSYATWKSRFNGDPHILGTKVLTGSPISSSASCPGASSSRSTPAGSAVASSGFP